MKTLRSYSYKSTLIASTLLYFIQYGIVVLAFAGVLPHGPSITALLILFTGSLFHAMLAPCPSKEEMGTPEN